MPDILGTFLGWVWGLLFLLLVFGLIGKFAKWEEKNRYEQRELIALRRERYEIQRKKEAERHERDKKKYLENDRESN